MSTNVQTVRKSRNAKTGPIPTTVSSKATCPDACPLKDNGCYASAGFHTRLNWDKVTSGERGDDYPGFLAQIRQLPVGQLWRHNVAGDLQGADDRIARKPLVDLVAANRDRRGFTYTHYPLSVKGNRDAIEYANENGFTVNVSCDTPEEAATVKASTSLPVVSLVPDVEYWGGAKSAMCGGQVITRCPAEYKDDVTCASCKLCSVADRQTIVGFTAHGTQSKQASIIARG